MKPSKILLLLLVAALIAGFFVFDFERYLTLEYLKSQQAAIDGYVRTHPWQTTLVYFAVYVAVTALSLPGAALMTLAGGAIFGLLWGTVVVSFASTFGATAALLIARFLFRDSVQRRFGRNLAAVNAGIRKDGAFYLFMLRLVPLFPFFIINLVMGLTPIRTATFFLVSQLGMLPGTVVYVNAGTQIARIDSLAGILAPELLGAFVLLGVFPLAARRFVAALQARRVLRRFPRPRRFDRNLVVIGAGAAGLVSAYIAATLRAKVTLVEKHRMGGECLNVGCVPSKALIRSARLLADIARARELGVRGAHAELDFAEVMERVQAVIARVAPHDSVERYTGLGVDCVLGEARIRSPYEVEVNGRALSTRAIMVATGSRPLVPAIRGIESVPYLTSDTVWEQRVLPQRLLVLGGGAVGCELAQCFARFGARVVLVQRGARLLAREDEEFSHLVAERLRADGVELRLGHGVREFRRRDGGWQLLCERGDESVAIDFDQLLLAVGRTPSVAGLGLEALGVDTTEAGHIEVDDYMRTRCPTVYACGDVAGPYQFTHTAAHQAWFATVNALLGGVKRFKVDYRVIPWATFTDPEVARVGLNEQQARAQGIPYEVTSYGIDDLDRAITDGEAHGLVKVLTVPGKDRILGATIAGAHAAELIAEFVTAMRHGLGLNKILGTIHVYPTFTEANKYAAGAWKRAHAPARALGWLERYHRWRLG